MIKPKEQTSNMDEMKKDLALTQTDSLPPVPTPTDTPTFFPEFIMKCSWFFSSGQFLHLDKISSVLVTDENLRD